MSSSAFALATFGGGCFWCLEAIFEQLQGVQSVTSGYSGGTAETADYKTVCTGTTDHAEVVQITFDPAIIRYEDLLQVFFTTHDPTTLNRQGNDVGTQYRSVIFYHDEAQRQAAEDAIHNFAPTLWDDPIVTQLVPLEAYYPAENYHQGYYQATGDRNPYCTIVITPKVAKFRKAFAARLKEGYSD